MPKKIKAFDRYKVVQKQKQLPMDRGTLFVNSFVVPGGHGMISLTTKLLFIPRRKVTVICAMDEWSSGRDIFRPIALAILLGI